MTQRKSLWQPVVWSPGQRDGLKTLALVLMAVDHAWRVLQLDPSWMFIAGRGAFPLFALVWGLNLAGRTLTQNGITRLWGWAMFAQLAWVVAGFPWSAGNILFVFAVAAQALKWCGRGDAFGYAGAAVLTALWLPFSSSSYGVAGLLLLALSYRLYRTPGTGRQGALMAGILATVMWLNAGDGIVASLSGVGIMLMAGCAVRLLPERVPRFWPRDAFPLLYAGHLVLLALPGMLNS